MSSSPYAMRRSFVFRNGKLEMCERRGVSCFQWLVKDGGMDIDTFVNTVHGAHYPGRAYFYKGLDNTSTDEEVERIAELCKDQFNTHTEICCGAFKGEDGAMWKPIKTIGYGTLIDAKEKAAACTSQ